jgi:predicted transcriptional regulator of viral defense system
VTPRQSQLRALANDQGGYFTARQAEQLGLANNNHARYVASGEWMREMRGIYRLADVPTTNPALAELHMWLLWTTGRASTEPRGAIAYETALSVYDLSDLIIHRVHLWVPTGFRVSVIPKNVVLHRESRAAADITRRDGLLVIQPLPTLIDLLREGRVSHEHIRQGLFDGLRKGVVTRDAVVQAAQLVTEARLLNKWILEGE